ncbi:MAG TPA: hypothetical protein VNM45_13020 [Bacillus sp. (in: firmicutes)]|nr:hypothetical protein [Bacillus sp. (in: firmicutes)]
MKRTLSLMTSLAMVLTLATPSVNAEGVSTSLGTLYISLGKWYACF